jgi:hypothetical protein
VANVKKQFKMFQMYSHMQRRNATGVEEKKEQETTGHDRFYQERSRYGELMFGDKLSRVRGRGRLICWR